jgi:hypothetical protein
MQRSRRGSLPASLRLAYWPSNSVRKAREERTLLFEHLGQRFHRAPHTRHLADTFVINDEPPVVRNGLGEDTNELRAPEDDRARHDTDAHSRGHDVRRHLRGRGIRLGRAQRARHLGDRHLDGFRGGEHGQSLRCPIESLSAADDQPSFETILEYRQPSAGTPRCYPESAEMRPTCCREVFQRDGRRKARRRPLWIVNPSKLHCVVLCCFGLGASSAAAEPLRDRHDDLLPARFRQVLALEDGSALVLGAASQTLLQVRQDGSVASLDHPPAGALLHVAARGPELWVLGTDAILYRRSNGAWSSAALSIRQVPPKDRLEVPWRAAEIVPIPSGDLVLLRALEDSTGEPVGQIVLMTRELAVEQQLTFARVRFSSGVADESGAVWFLANVAPTSPEMKGSSLGYCRFSAGRWTLWQVPGATEWPLPDFELQRASIPVFLESLAANPNGGAYGLWGGGLYGINQAGEIQLLRSTSVADDRGSLDSAMDIDGTSGKITILQSPYQDRDHLRLVHIDGDARSAEVRRVPIPDWFAEVNVAPPLHEKTLSQGRSHTWISAGPLLFAVQPDPGGRAGVATVVYSSPNVRKHVADVDHELALIEIRKWVVSILSTVVLLAAAASSAGRFHRERFRATFLQALIGAAASLLPALVLDGCSPARGWGIGLAGGLNLIFFSTAALATPLASAFATFLSAALFWPRAPFSAFAGALLGATLGTVFAVLATLWIHERHRAFDFATLGLTVALVSGAATLGYHALRGKAAALNERPPA